VGGCVGEGEQPCDVDVHTLPQGGSWPGRVVARGRLPRVLTGVNAVLSRQRGQADTGKPQKVIRERVTPARLLATAAGWATRGLHHGRLSRRIAGVALQRYRRRRVSHRHWHSHTD